ncbi:phospholipid/cholesterol/gamma-HCH transport system ATP-binding protein [Natronocella acetinitrilica]|uniref:Phospholipid/cholesterol/gamma-HCH transport system ATP-binding protein n=1 Tax=Natronocella acetinitrilica TaxID=414046 RepID=A0AAE3G832_9GAMM|nr:ATP-binding cassette domain-containing protein [Natronocella acetinitrilica]MCP1675522.1 phospholipid/cholesterol/gamma-HCH transport system ATP-binding protein [Natronocella acetinitrilica]
MATRKAVIEVRGLGTVLGGQTIHDALDLDVTEREVLAIVGGSGSGKTVLLRELSLLMEPTKGSIRLFGEDHRKLRGERLRDFRADIGIMFQQGALFTGMSVLENVEFPLKEHTRLDRSSRAELAMIKLSLAGFPQDGCHKKPAELSGGMVKRAALARALALDPALLFLDEPTAGLDPVTAAAFDDRILELRDLLGLTVVLVTHDLDSLWRISDRVAFLARKRVLMAASIADISRSDETEIRAYFQGPRQGGRPENDESVQGD